MEFGKSLRISMLSEPKVIFLLVIFLICVDIRAIHDRLPEKRVFQDHLDELPITFPVQSAEITEYFNQIARPEDIASFPPGFTQLMPLVTKGRRMASFPSWSAAEAELEGINAEIELVMYNPEHWEYTPVDEQEHLIQTVMGAKEVLRARRLGFFLAPDRKFTDEALADLAPLADGILLQGQRLQEDPEIFASWVQEKVEIARSANPDVRIFVQVGATQGTPEQMFLAIQAVSMWIDGVAVWSTPRTLKTLQTFIQLLRETLPRIDTALPSTFTPGLAKPAGVPGKEEKALLLPSCASTVLPMQPSTHVIDEATVPPPASQGTSPVPSRTHQASGALNVPKVAGVVIVVMLTLIFLLVRGKLRKPG